MPERLGGGARLSTQTYDSEPWLECTASPVEPARFGRTDTGRGDGGALWPAPHDGRQGPARRSPTRNEATETTRTNEMAEMTPGCAPRCRRMGGSARCSPCGFSRPCAWTVSSAHAGRIVGKARRPWGDLELAALGR